MPRSFDEYTRQQWLRLRPVVERYKMGRYARRSAWHVRRRAAAGNAAAVARDIEDRRLLISVAFDDPQLVRWQADLIRHHVHGCVHLIIDNSSDDHAARRIEADAAARGLSYLRFAGNPWSETEYSRSHGLAMSWAWHNVVRPGAPEAFGFIDHDLFPTEDADPFAPLSQAPVWGHVLDRGRRWYLWAGFCFFRYEAVKTSNLDFRHDWYADLDTGGFNWHRLYRHLDRDKIPSIAMRPEPALPGRPIKDARFDKLGSWLHECGSGGLRELRAEKRAVLARRLAPLLAAAGADHCAA
jgi:hypothetical protein